MSRYVEVTVDAANLDEVAAALGTLEIAYQRAQADPVMLEGSLECPGQPVEIRVEAGTRGAVEDFGFVTGDDGAPRLVCGDLDRSRLEGGLLGPLKAAIARARALAVATESGLTAEERVERDGTRRILLRREP